MNDDESFRKRISSLEERMTRLERSHSEEVRMLREQSRLHSEAIGRMMMLASKALENIDDVSWVKQHFDWIIKTGRDAGFDSTPKRPRGAGK